MDKETALLVTWRQLPEWLQDREFARLIRAAKRYGRKSGEGTIQAFRKAVKKLEQKTILSGEAQ